MAAGGMPAMHAPRCSMHTRQSDVHTPVRHVALAVHERCDDLGQRQQALVDVDGLLQARALRTRALGALRASQVHQVHLRVARRSRRWQRQQSMEWRSHTAMAVSQRGSNTAQLLQPATGAAQPQPPFALAAALQQARSHLCDQVLVAALALVRFLLVVLALAAAAAAAVAARQARAAWRVLHNRGRARGPHELAAPLLQRDGEDRVAAARPACGSTTHVGAHMASQAPASATACTACMRQQAAQAQQALPPRPPPPRAPGLTATALVCTCCSCWLLPPRA